MRKALILLALMVCLTLLLGLCSCGSQTSYITKEVSVAHVKTGLCLSTVTFETEDGELWSDVYSNRALKNLNVGDSVVLVFAKGSGFRIRCGFQS